MLTDQYQQESAHRTHIDHKYYGYRRDRISCIVIREMVAKVPSNKSAEDQYRDHNERNRQDQ